jgi:hypothetical protein
MTSHRLVGSPSSSGPSRGTEIAIFGVAAPCLTGRRLASYDKLLVIKHVRCTRVDCLRVVTESQECKIGIRLCGELRSSGSS